MIKKKTKNTYEKFQKNRRRWKKGENADDGEWEKKYEKNI